MFVCTHPRVSVSQQVAGTWTPSITLGLPKAPPPGGSTAPPFPPGAPPPPHRPDDKVSFTTCGVSENVVKVLHSLYLETNSAIGVGLICVWLHPFSGFTSDLILVF